MDNKYLAERQELHRNIWKIADEVRGSVDGWDFKQYVLGILFYRFISENLVSYLNNSEPDPDFDYASLSDEEADKYFKESCISDKGFYIKPSHLFANVCKTAKTNDNLNIDLANIFVEIEASSLNTNSQRAMQGLFSDLDTSNPKLGSNVTERNKTLRSVLFGIRDIKFREFTENEIDAFGDAYEFLISKYASNAGKSGGEYFTPQCVSKLLAKLSMVGKEKINKAYDPTIGSGSLILQLHKLFGKDVTKEGYYGQEKNLTTYNLARMNMFLHNINYSKFNVVHGDTLLNPMHLDDRPFDVILSNPPYSVRWVGEDDPTLKEDVRFCNVGKLAPKSKGDFAFILHSLYHLSGEGTACIVCFPGIFYRSGAEKTIRKYLVDNGHVDTIIQLPSNLFFGTSIATCVLVMRKQNADSVFFIDASNLYKAETNNNILTDEHIEEILNTFKEKRDVPHFAKLVPSAVIRDNDYNLAVSSYVEKPSNKEEIDIKVLNKEIDEVVLNIDRLRNEINALVKELSDE